MTKERPILFSAPMVRAILENRKTQTRRVVKPQPTVEAGRGVFDCLMRWKGNSCGSWREDGDCTAQRYLMHFCPYGKPGDRLWVRELHWRWGKWVKNGLTKSGRTKWTFIPVGTSIRYAENAPKTTAKRDGECGWVYRHARFMFHAHSRILLEIADVRVHRLQDISEEDAQAEGASGDWFCESCRERGKSGCYPYTHNFAELWESINGSGSWDVNPFVWAITFRRTEASERAA